RIAKFELVQVSKPTAESSRIPLDRAPFDFLTSIMTSATDTHASQHDSQNGHAAHRESFEVRVLRQDGPGQSSYWQRFRVPYENDMNIISVLQRIAQMATTHDGERVAPVAWDCNCLEEVCGACTMVINGRVRQACSALVDR